MPAAAPLIASAPLLCGKRLPPFDGVANNDSGESNRRPVCRRSKRAYWKIFRRARRAFADAVEADPSVALANNRREGSSMKWRTRGGSMSDAMETIETPDSERSRVESWRLHVLMEAGYPLPLAERIAGSEHIDLHRAVELVASGCTPETAAEILL
jgi:hypothetical protein